MPEHVYRFSGLSFGRAVAGFFGLLLLAACSASDDPESKSDDTSDRPAAVPVFLTETVPAGTTSGKISARTAKRFRLSGTHDFLIEKGSRLDGQFVIAYVPEDRKWRLSVDWHTLSAKGISRLRNIGRNPPFYTQENIEGSPDISPALSPEQALPIRLFTLRARRQDFERIIPMPDAESE